MHISSVLSYLTLAVVTCRGSQLLRITIAGFTNLIMAYWQWPTYGVQESGECVRCFENYWIGTRYLFILNSRDSTCIVIKLLYKKLNFVSYTRTSR